MKKIIILKGPPAAGKSVRAKEIYASDPLKYVIVSRDNIRDARGNYWVPEQENYISDLEEFSVVCAIKHNLIPIIDATNLNPKTIDKWKNLAKELGADIEWIELYVPFKVALERDKNRERSVTEPILKRFYMNYYPDKYMKEMEV